jgi:hypothetical protein
MLAGVKKNHGGFIKIIQISTCKYTKKIKKQAVFFKILIFS